MTPAAARPRSIERSSPAEDPGSFVVRERTRKPNRQKHSRPQAYRVRKPVHDWQRPRRREAMPHERARFIATILFALTLELVALWIKLPEVLAQ